MNVKKRNGDFENLDLAKIHNVLIWATKNINNVSISQIELNANLQLKNNITTEEIHTILTRSAADLIDEKTPNYQFVAGRLQLMQLRKDVYDSFEPMKFKDIIKRNINLNLYDEEAFNSYTAEEIDFYGSKVNHDNDFTFTWSMIRTNIDSYLIKDKITNKYYETPQEIFMLIPMVLFAGEPNRKELILEYYIGLSSYELSIPSPIMAGVRTKIKGYSSCCLIDHGDSRDSLIAANGAGVVMTTIRAGIGGFKGWIRGEGAKVGKHTTHAGIVNILKWNQGAIKAFGQGNRGGSATDYFPFWHWEIERIIKLKSNKLPDDESVRGLDYGIGLNKLILDRADKNENITLFSSEETKDLITNVYNYDLWVETYIAYENEPGIRKKSINARKFLKEYFTEYFETGRVYPYFLDNMNQKSFNRSLYMLNLCAEITLPVKELKYLQDPEGEIALCILTNINAGKIKNIGEIKRLAHLAVRSLDNIIDIQDYPLPAAENSSKNGRYLGIGVSDWAHYLSRKKVKYDTQEALDLAEEFAEHLQFNLLTASNELAMEKGEANWFRRDSSYANGYLPNDGKWRFIPKEKWEALRTNIIKFGLRNLVLSAIPPAATSSDANGSTSGIDLIRSFVITKNSKSGPVKQVVPNFSKGSSYYTLTSEVNNIKYLEMISKFQLYIDQSISTNTWFDKSYLDSEGKMSMKLIKNIIYKAHELGLKSLYYMNFDDTEIAENCSGGGCKV